MFTCDCPGIDARAKVGQFWQASKPSGEVKWEEYSAENILMA